MKCEQQTETRGGKAVPCSGSDPLLPSNHTSGELEEMCALTSKILLQHSVLLKEAAWSAPCLEHDDRVCDVVRLAE